MGKVLFITLLMSLLASTAYASTDVCDEGDAVCLSTTDIFTTDDSAMVSYVKPHAKIVLSDSDFSKFVTVEIIRRNELETEYLHKKYAIGPKSKVIAAQEVEIAGTTGTQSHVQKTVMGKKYDYIIVDFISGNYYFVLTGWTSNAEFSKYKQNILDAIYTFKFNNRKVLPKVAVEPY